MFRVSTACVQRRYTLFCDAREIQGRYSKIWALSFDDRLKGLSARYALRGRFGRGGVRLTVTRRTRVDGGVRTRCFV
jgi:hypothetical protein